MVMWTSIIKFEHQYTNMRIVLFFSAFILIFASCKKDKYTTAPQIKFKSVNPNVSSSAVLATDSDLSPKLTIEITDAEGDLGYVQGFDTSMIYIKNLLTQNLDSFLLPDIQTAGTKNFKADIIVNLFDVLECGPVPPFPIRPRTDTTFFEVYVTDFAKNKSNVIVTGDPVYYRCL